MKQFSTLAIFLLFLFPNLLLSQSYDYVTGHGFNTLPGALTQLTEGRWLAVAIGSPMPGGFYSDTVVAVVFNSNGEILLEKRLDLPASEVYRVQSVAGTPDGGFAIAISRNLCDVLYDKSSLLFFHADGTLKWSRHEDNLLDFIRWTQNGFLVGIRYGNNQLMAFDTANGAKLWEAFLTNSPAPAFAADYEMLDNGETVLTVGAGDIHCWGKVNSNTFAFRYSISDNGVGSSRKIIAHPALDNVFFTVDHYNDRIYRFSSLQSSLTLLADLPFEILDMVATDSKLVALAYSAPTTFLVNIDFQGVILDTIRTFKPLLRGESIAYQNNTIAVAGINGSGPFTNSPWQPYNANHLWLHTNHLNDAPPTAEANVSLTQATPATSLVVDSSSGQYHVSCDKFLIEVTNLGTTPLEEVDVQIGFQLKSWICPYRPVKKIHFSGLALLPNESTWLDFGKVEGTLDSNMPSQLCFWTAAPNRLPDADPSNDIYCKSIQTVMTYEPGNTTIRVMPNPADESVQVTFPALPSTGSWKMFDITGRQVRAGVIETAISDLHITTSDLVPGLYLLCINENCLKIAVKH